MVSAFLIELGLRTCVIERERRRMALALLRYLDLHLARAELADRPIADIPLLHFKRGR